MKRMKKLILLIIFTLYILIAPTLSVNATSYNYSEYLRAIEAPEAMIVKRIIASGDIIDDDGEKVTFSNLRDVFVLESETLGTRIYLLDSDNNVLEKNRIIVLDENFEYLRQYPKKEDFIVPPNGELNYDYLLKNPSGLFVTESAIYIADTDAERLAIFTHNWGLRKAIKNPEDPTFDNLSFKPLKVAVDKNNRIYVVASNVFEGIIDFNPDYTFNRYIGSSAQSESVWSKIWSLIVTREQSSKRGLSLAITYNNLTVDDGNFIYALSNRASGKPVRKINSKGSDVLKQKGYGLVLGDYQIYSEYSNFVDITIGKSETYSVLDKTMARIFTYDFEGKLLYISGGSSIFRIPEAISYFGENLLVVDSSNKNLVILEPTEFAHQVNLATDAYYLNNYEEAAIEWEKVLMLNTNYFPAYGGIGKAQYRQGLYQEAMENFKLATDIYNYSAAYKEYRTQKLEHVLPYILIAGFVVVIGVMTFSVVKRMQESKLEGGDD